MATSSGLPSPELYSVSALHERGDDVGVLTRGLGIQSPEPGVLEVFGRNRVPVRPLDPVAQGERVVELVLADVHAFRHIRNGPGVWIQPVQARHHVQEYLCGDGVRGLRGVQIPDGLLQVDGDGLAASTTPPPPPPLPPKTPQPGTASMAAPARPVPLIFKKSLRDIPGPRRSVALLQHLLDPHRFSFLSPALTARDSQTPIVWSPTIIRKLDGPGCSVHS